MRYTTSQTFVDYLRHLSCMALFLEVSILGSLAPAVASPLFGMAADGTHGSATTEITLVFLPLENMGQPIDGFLSDGLHADITLQLARTPGIRVLARNSAARVRRSMSSTDIAGTFRITHVLIGTGRRVEGRFRVELELTRPEYGPMWKRVFECSAADLSPLAKEIGSETFRALGLATPPARSIKARAYELHLRALHLHTRLAITPGARRSRDEECARLWEEALRLDPGFLSAAEELAVVETDLSVSNPEPESRAYYAEKAKRWAEFVSVRRGATGYYPVALYAWRVEQDLPSALVLATHQAAAAPNDTANQILLGEILAKMDRVRDSIDAYQRGLDLDPMNPPVWERLLLSASMSRNPALTRGALIRLSALEIKPDLHAAASALFRVDGTLPVDVSEMNLPAQVLWAWRARTFAEGLARLDAVRTPLTCDLLCRRADLLRRLGRETEARVAAASALGAAKRVASEKPEGADAALARALARVGRDDEAVAAMQSFVRSDLGAAESRALREVELAELYAYLDRGREAVQLIRRLLQRPSGLTVPMLQLDPTWDTLRHTPEFDQLLVDPRNLAAF
jgi:TolB-like protein/tetratricopeptide (TPR) repeat protein